MPRDPYQLIRVEQAGDVAVVRFLDTRYLDPDVIDQLGHELYSLVDTEGCRILLNFEAVRYVSSSVIGKLMALRQKVTDAGGKLKLSNFHRDFLQVFKILRLEEVFSIYDDEAAAFAAFGKN